MSTRRNFMAMIGISPIAGPVVAKEAAVAMGLSGPIGGALANGGYAISPGAPVGLAGGGRSWAQRALDYMNSDVGAREIDADARHAARVLDPDLAAMRSVSPAYAYRRQRERCEIEIRERRTASIMRQIADEAKQDLLG